MKVLHLGTAIRERRLELGLSQEQVCAGICETITLSRVESGKQTPSHNRIKALLQRLGMPDDRYYALLSPHELELKNVQKEVLACSGRVEQVRAEQRKEAWALAMEQVHRLEKLTEKDDFITQQFIQSIKAVLGTEAGAFSFKDRLTMLLKALHITIPNFDLNKIGVNRYSVDETRILCQIATTYSNAGEHDRALTLYSQVYEYVRKNDEALSNFAAHITLIAYNYACELDLLKYYYKAIEIIEDGLNISRKYGYYQFLPGFLAIMGECYYFMHEEEKSIKRYVQAHYLYEVLGDEHNLRIIDTDIQKRFHFEFPI